MLKYGGKTVVEWMCMICDFAWKQGEVPDECLHKGKDNKDECNKYRRKSLFSVPGKVYGKILTERLM